MILQCREQPQEYVARQDRHAALEDRRDRAQAFDQHEIGAVDCKRVLLRECRDERAVSRNFRFDDDHDLPFLPCAREVGRQDHVQCR